MARILIADGDEGTSEVLGDVLWKSGHAVMFAATAVEAASMADERKPDIAIVELDLPGLDGSDLLRRLTADAGRLLVLTQSAAEAFLVPRGATWLAKPFSLGALSAKVAEMIAELAPRRSRAIDVGPLRVDRDTQEVLVGEREIDLTAMELALLLYLHDNSGLAQSREALLHHVWGMRGRVATRTVDTHIKRLRQKLGPAAEYIVTVQGLGYRFAGPP